MYMYPKVEINRLVVDYSYDMNQCDDGYSQWTGDSEGYTVGKFDGGYVWQRMCPNPVTLIHNYGHIEMGDIRINMIINNDSAQINATANQRGFNFDDDGDCGFINNFGVLAIRKLTMNNSLSRYMFHNKGRVYCVQAYFAWCG